jgi:DNA repair protein RadC
MKKDKFIKYLDSIREGLELKVGEVSLSYTIEPERASELPQIKRSANLYDFILPKWESDIQHIERFKVVFVNRQNRIIGFYNLSKGTEAGTTCSVKSIVMMVTNIPTCAGVFLCHNHPSGNINPSKADE